MVPVQPSDKLPRIAIFTSHCGLNPTKNSHQHRDDLVVVKMTSETRTTLTLLSAGLIAAMLVLGADMSWADVAKVLF